MKVYVFAMAYASSDDWANITETQVFKTLDEAKRYMEKLTNEHINDPDDDWLFDWGGEPNDTSVHLSCCGHSDEVVMRITEHEL